MKLWLIKQACDQLTNVQDVNAIIYMMYKRCMVLDILMNFREYYNRHYGSINMSDFINMTVYYSKWIVCCWMIDNKGCDTNQSGGVIFKVEIPRSLPGICNKCMLKI
jgi:hypothetical protein